MADDSKTEKATPKKRKDERKKGNVFVSKDMVSAVSLLMIFYALKFLFPIVYDTISKFTNRYIVNASQVVYLTPEYLFEIVKDVILTFIATGLPFLLVTCASAIIATGVQTKFLMTGESIKFKLEKLDPIKGFKRMFSLKGLVEVLKGIIKIIIIGYVLYTFVFDRLNQFNRLYQIDLMQSCVFMLNSMIDLAINTTFVFLIIACFDYLYQWWDYEKNIRMSKQEIKEEYKQLEGNPEIKGKIRQKQKQMAFSRMMQDVPKADVIIKNPTHFAVALKYDMDKGVAPIVIAKGQDELALKIIEVGGQNNVHIVENVQLARALYASVDIGQIIPQDYYGVIAEILAVVYSSDKKERL